MDKRVLWAIDVAIEGRKHLHYQWEGEYGLKYDGATKENRLKQIEEELQQLHQLKGDLR